jgi:protein-tyrosine-phosphatase
MCTGRRVILSLLVFSSALLSQTKEKTVTAPTVVFVCEHGAAKSIIAAAEFNRMAQEKGLPQRAIARGTNPDAQFAPGVLAGLNKDGLTVPAGKPQLVSEADIKNADRVVTLGCKLPEGMKTGAKTTDWSEISPPSQGYDKARKDISRNVEQLINDLARERPAK